MILGITGDDPDKTWLTPAHAEALIREAGGVEAAMNMIFEMSNEDLRQRLDAALAAQNAAAAGAAAGAGGAGAAGAGAGITEGSAEERQSNIISAVMGQVRQQAAGLGVTWVEELSEEVFRDIVHMMLHTITGAGGDDGDDDDDDGARPRTLPVIDLPEEVSSGRLLSVFTCL